MYSYKNVDITPGLPYVLTFEIKDDDSAKVPVETSTFRVEIFDSDQKLILLKTTFFSRRLGEVVFVLSDAETFTLKKPNYSYRLVVVDSTGFSKIYYQGFLACKPPSYQSGSTPDSSVITLPDGTLYATTQVTVTGDVWYAVSSVFRFVASGIGTLVMDGKDLRGTVWPNVSVFMGDSLEQRIWTPDLEGMTSFRIKMVSGSVTLKYLP